MHTDLRNITASLFPAMLSGRTRIQRIAIALALSAVALPCLQSSAQADQILNLVCHTDANWPGYAGTQYVVKLDLNAQTVNEMQIYPNGQHSILPDGDITFVSSGVIAGHLDGSEDAFSLNRYTGVLTLQVVPSEPPHPHTFICQSGRPQF
ncbi:MAG: hypothetical protein M0T84_18290 [Betaproteobacteria bacterium]|nr:hypothetical protein [Betaproteobacteria bacterium]